MYERFFKDEGSPICCVFDVDLHIKQKGQLICRGFQWIDSLAKNPPYTIW